MADDPPPLRLVSDRTALWEWESFPRLAVRPRYRQGALVPWRKAQDGVHIPAEAESVPDGKES